MANEKYSWVAERFFAEKVSDVKPFDFDVGSRTAVLLVEDADDYRNSPALVTVGTPRSR